MLGRIRARDVSLSILALGMFGLTFSGCSAVGQRVRTAVALSRLARTGHQYQTFSIAGASMKPAIAIGSVLIVDESAFAGHAPQRGDIVAFDAPVASAAPFVKRVLGLPGDRLRISDGTVYVNDRALKEPYVSARPDYSLVIKNYNIYVNDGYGEGLQPLNPTMANVPPRKYWLKPDSIPLVATASSTRKSVALIYRYAGGVPG